MQIQAINAVLTSVGAFVGALLGLLVGGSVPEDVTEHPALAVATGYTASLQVPPVS